MVYDCEEPISDDDWNKGVKFCTTGFRRYGYPTWGHANVWSLGTEWDDKHRMVGKKLEPYIQKRRDLGPSGTALASLCCPLAADGTLPTYMKDPVMLTNGNTMSYERALILQYRKSNNTDPLTNQELKKDTRIVGNRTLCKFISELAKHENEVLDEKLAAQLLATINSSIYPHLEGN